MFVVLSAALKNTSEVEGAPPPKWSCFLWPSLALWPFLALSGPLWLSLAFSASLWFALWPFLQHFIGCQSVCVRVQKMPFPCMKEFKTIMHYGEVAMGGATFSSNSEFLTLPLILSASRQICQLSLSFDLYPNIPNAFVGDEMNSCRSCSVLIHMERESKIMNRIFWPPCSIQKKRYL